MLLLLTYLACFCTAIPTIQEKHPLMQLNQDEKDLLEAFFLDGRFDPKDCQWHEIVSIPGW
jgi:hypothetical protein